MANSTDGSKPINAKRNSDVNHDKKAGGKMSNTTAKEIHEDISNGIYLCGTIIGRSRAYVGENKRELVTYKIMANNNVYFLKDWRRDPNSEYFCVGETIRVPVLISVDEYKGRHNLAITLKDVDTGEF